MTLHSTSFSLLPTRARARAHTLTHARTLARTLARTHARTHAHTHTHTHTHTHSALHKYPTNVLTILPKHANRVRGHRREEKTKRLREGENKQKTKKRGWGDEGGFR